MPAALTPWTFTGMLAALMAWGMAVFVLRHTPDRDVGRRFALLLGVEGAVVATSHAGIPLFIASAPSAYAIALLHVVFDALLIALYLPFLARALNTPVLQPFRSRRVEATMLLIPTAAIAGVLLVPEHFVTDFAAAQGSYLRWIYAPGPVWTAFGVLLVIMFVFSLIAALFALRTAATPVVRRRARAFAFAFGVRDVFWAAVYIVALTVEVDTGMTFAGPVLQAYALSLIVYVLLTGYGILTAHLFDIDLRIKWTIQQSSIAAVFVAVFFLVSEAAATFLSDRLGTVFGLLAASLLVFLLAPLERAAARLADAAMPSVQPTPEYASFRKLQIYAAALEGAFQDGEITGRERAMLDNLSRTLGVHAADAARLEAEAQSARPAADLVPPLA